MVSWSRSLYDVIFVKKEVLKVIDFILLSQFNVCCVFQISSYFLNLTPLLAEKKLFENLFLKKLKKELSCVLNFWVKSERGSFNKLRLRMFEELSIG